MGLIKRKPKAAKEAKPKESKPKKATKFVGKVDLQNKKGKRG